MCKTNTGAALVIALAVAAGTGCGRDSGNGIQPTTHGTLNITIYNGVGAPVRVTITGPNGYSKAISSSQVISDLPTGSYTIVGDSTVVPDSIVGGIVNTAAVTGSPANLSGGDTAQVLVTFAGVSRGGMWVAVSRDGAIGGFVVDFSSNQLRTTGSPPPAVVVTPPLASVSGLAFDSLGNMWVSSGGNDTLVAYSAGARAYGNPAPTGWLASSSITGGSSLAVDAKGNLWVPRCGSPLFSFTAAQLATGGTQVPAVSITSSAVQCPSTVVFDARGNLWVADGMLNRLVQFTAAQLTTSGSTTPAVTIGATGGSLNNPTALAFDSSGNLWALGCTPSNCSDGQVVEYTPDQLAASNTPVPHVTVTMPAQSFPSGMAFDNRGTLWVSAYDEAYAFTRDQLASSGSPQPAVTLSSIYGDGGQLVFDPHAAAIGPSAARHHSPPSVAAAVTSHRASVRRLP
jgi:sugar lactone lactonase YvrE